ncbi:MAG: hypothetical protein WBB19_13480 [Desulforhopalus sp.]
MLKKFSAIPLSILTLMTSGCFHSPAPYVPADAAVSVQGETITECQNTMSCLQILIMYGSHICAHAALRLEYPTGKSLFWDPAGGYGKAGSVFAERDRDVIHRNAPTLNEYIFFRTEIETAAAEIFEWRIEAQQADKLYNILSRGTDDAAPEGKFSPQGAGLFCSSHVSEFLQRFAGDLLTVEKVFYPHALAKQLYTQSPDRVIIINFDDYISIREIQ